MVLHFDVETVVYGFLIKMLLYSNKKGSSHVTGQKKSLFWEPFLNDFESGLMTHLFPHDLISINDQR